MSFQLQELRKEALDDCHNISYRRGVLFCHQNGMVIGAFSCKLSAGLLHTCWQVFVFTLLKQPRLCICLSEQLRHNLLLNYFFLLKQSTFMDNHWSVISSENWTQRQKDRGLQAMSLTDLLIPTVGFSLTLQKWNRHCISVCYGCCWYGAQGPLTGDPSKGQSYNEHPSRAEFLTEHKMCWTLTVLLLPLVV